ncbi:MAG: hypothetical protein WC876_11155 [Candidatus Thermoplasmatota archaeon]|jgi:hypothetical protein
MRSLSLTCLLFTVLFGCPGASADDQDDAAWRQEERDLSFTLDPDGFQFTSERHSRLGDDRLVGTFDATAAVLTYDFAATGPGNATELRVGLAWQALVEFRDLDHDGRFGLADEAVQTLAVPSLPVTVATTPNLPGRHSALVTYALPINTSKSPLPTGQAIGPQGTLRIEFTVVSASIGAGAAAQSPLDVAFQVEVSDFPYDSSGTLLALVAQGSGKDLEPGLLGLAMAADGLSTSVSWAKGGRADGASFNTALSTLLQEPGKATMSIVFPHAQEVGQAGVVTSQRQQAPLAPVVHALIDGDWRWYLAGIAAVSVLLGGPSLARLRRN